MNYLWPGHEAAGDTKIMVTTEGRDYKHTGNVVLGILGIGLESLGALGVAEGRGRDAAAVAFGLFIAGTGYLYDNGGIKTSFSTFKAWAADKLLHTDETVEVPAEQIASPPVIV